MIIKEMTSRGLVFLEKVSEGMRREVSDLEWLRKTIMVFKKDPTGGDEQPRR